MGLYFCLKIYICGRFKCGRFKTASPVELRPYCVTVASAACGVNQCLLIRVERGWNGQLGARIAYQLHIMAMKSAGRIYGASFRTKYRH
jgi:hypothetical protein